MKIAHFTSLQSTTQYQKGQFMSSRVITVFQWRGELPKKLHDAHGLNGSKHHILNCSQETQVQKLADDLAKSGILHTVHEYIDFGPHHLVTFQGNGDLQEVSNQHQLKALLDQHDRSPVIPKIFCKEKKERKQRKKKTRRPSSPTYSVNRTPTKRT